MEAYQVTLNKYATTSKINVSSYERVCAVELGYDQKMCDLYFGIMYAESQFCTDRYKDIEEYYANCSGFKSKEILATHSPDENGSWLRQFNSLEEYYRVSLTTFKNYYWDNAGVQLRTPSQVSRKWIGRPSPSWVTAVTTILNSLNSQK